jgi:CheY-like chemotaxis protein
MGYRITADGATVTLITDHEPYTRMPLRPGREILHLGDRRLVTFVEGSDLLIHDGQYTDEEFLTRAGWGHSTARYAASIAVASGSQRLALFHHDPSHDDEVIDREVARTRELLAGIAAAPEVFGAAEGQELRLSGRQEPSIVRREPTVQTSRDRRPRLLVADDDRMVVRMVQQALAEDDYELLIAPNGEEALSLARSSHPDLFILDAVMPKTNGFEVCSQLRKDPASARVPIIMLTSLDDPQFVTRGFKEGASDYITKPFTPTMLRSRVRSWLAGSGVL